MPAALGIRISHIQRVPAEPSMHAAHGSPLVGYVLTLLGVGGCAGRAVKSRASAFEWGN